MGENPYTLMFGKEPLQTISRFAQTRLISRWKLNTFRLEYIRIHDKAGMIPEPFPLVCKSDYFFPSGILDNTMSYFFF